MKTKPSSECFRNLSASGQKAPRPRRGRHPAVLTYEQLIERELWMEKNRDIVDQACERFLGVAQGQAPGDGDEPWEVEALPGIPGLFFEER